MHPKPIALNCDRGQRKAVRQAYRIFRPNRTQTLVTGKWIFPPKPNPLNTAHENLLGPLASPIAIAQVGRGDLAPLGLRAAPIYAKIAPEATHTQHMTSHIFLSLGMWDDEVKANETAMAVVKRARRKAGKATRHAISARQRAEARLVSG